jgi:pSer/pThr/pTyr-binding forkhead associated (FHA) protein
VESARASRRHAAVRRDGDRFFVHDLGSTNGTFVNGKKVGGKHALSPGDRIEIGDVSVTFCQVESALADGIGRGSADETMVMGPSHEQATSLQGSFEQVPAFAVLQMLELGGQTGLLSVENGKGAGKLWLDKGKPVHAEAAGQSGFDAAIAVTQSESGQFRFEPNAKAPKQTIDATLTHILLEASRLADEETR